ncbi:MAG: type I DNA topoisomerase [Chloroflexi bacterium]|nr:type I DNA topoisomerase [Chloroflexota bacterium]
MAKDLVIVESPAKGRTIGLYLGDRYVVKASQGHVRDLPEKEMGVDLTDGFSPKYVVPKEKRPIVQEIKKAALEASAVYLATDPDREGEAISWHLVQAAGLQKKDVHRVVFHEITAEAIRDAFKKPRQIDMNLVNAQQARRVLDRLVGYSLSPLLSRKLRWPGLSAGRVQSAALHLIVEREKQVQAFVPKEYWTIEAQLAPQRPVGKGEPQSFKALLHSLWERKEKLSVPSQAEALRLKTDLQGARYRVAQVQKRQVRQRPAAPFTTATLQQEAWRKLRFTAKRTMVLAQQLYEGVPLGKEGPVGLITYMRTDSTHVAPEAVKEARDYIASAFGPQYLPKERRTYVTRSKGAQEAHEAIRPTSARRTPDSVKSHLTPEQLNLYDLVWKRMVACQMADALLDSTTVEIQSYATHSSAEYRLRATGSVLAFPGFRALYREDRDEPEDEESLPLPNLSEGEALDCLDLSADQHFTQPPPRYTEATLVKALEQKGIGRPSTYVPIISTIQERGYVHKKESRFEPLPLGTVVDDLLTRQFPMVTDLDFTARMEEELDDIARGKRPWQPVVKSFYGPLEADLEKAKKDTTPIYVPTGETCELCSKPMILKSGRFGKFLSCSGYPDCRHSLPFRVRVGVPCPECKGDLVQRQARKGRAKGGRRVFYGCANYPQCTFTVGSKPLPQPCPQCSGLLVDARRNHARCIACKYYGPVTSEKEPASA